MKDMIQIFDSLTKSLESFRPLKGRLVRMYACGPTVYDFAHIGNFRSYVFEDILKRSLLADGYRVQHVMNITDVGHLTSNADEGEDKIERAAARQKKSATKITQFYTKAFLNDLKRLNILPADELPRATAYIPEQIALIRQLERRGFTYKTSDGIYFDTSKFAAYGQAFGGQKLEEKESGARVEVRSEKRSPHDFALWKFSPPGVKRQQEWSSPWGVGFPGWHIECSAMGRKLLGQPFDIHCGGIDHIPVHHTNEIAQSEAAYGKPLAKYWMHNAFLTVEGEKMGKSEGNLVTIDQIVERGFDPLAYRYLVLGAHYRSSLNFTWESVAAAQSALDHLREYCRMLPTPPRPPSHGEVGKNKISPPHFGRGSERGWGSETKDVVERFQGAFANDLDTPKALAVLWDLTKSSIAPIEQASIIVWLDGVLGLNLKKFIGKKVHIPKEVLTLAQQREDARKAKDWARADIVRAQIHALGFQVEDTSDGPKVKPIKP